MTAQCQHDQSKQPPIQRKPIMPKSIKTQTENTLPESKTVPLSGTLPQSVDTPEKAQNLFNDLHALRASVEKLGVFSERYKLVSAQCAAVQKVITHHAHQAEHKRAMLQIENDQVHLTEAVVATKNAVSLAEKSLQSALEKHANLESRLPPLVAKQNAEGDQVQARLIEAQRLFDAAMASGDEAAEANAAEALARAKGYGQPNAVTGSPIEIRVAALNNELANSQTQCAAAQSNLAQAIDDAHQAESNLSKLHYDRRVFDLVCFLANHEDRFGSIRSVKDILINTYQLQIPIDSAKRFMFMRDGNRLNIDSAILALQATSKKNSFKFLDVLLEDVNALPEENWKMPTPEPTVTGEQD